MSNEGPAPAPRARAVNGDGDPASWQWPPSSADLDAIWQVDVASVGGEQRCVAAQTRALAPSARRAVANRGTVGSSTSKAALQWPPHPLDVEGIFVVSLDGERESSGGIPGPPPVRSRTSAGSRWALAAAVGATLAVALPLMHIPPSDSSPEPSPAAAAVDHRASAAPPIKASASRVREPAEGAGSAAPSSVSHVETPPRREPVGAVVAAPLSIAWPRPSAIIPASTAASLAGTSTPSMPPAVLPPTPATDVGALSAVTSTAGAADVDLALVAMTAAPPAVATPVRTNGDADEHSVRDVLARYGAAYSRLDASAARAVWPSVDTRALGRAFSELRSQRVTFDRCDISIDGQHGLAACTGATTYVPRVGTPTPRTEPREWTFRLEKGRDDAWRIATARISGLPSTRDR